MEILGYDKVEALNCDEVTPPQYRRLDLIALEQLKTSGSCVAYEKSYKAKDGTLIPFLVGAAVISDASGEVEEVASFLADLRPQKQAEAALLQSEKLAAVGRLASSISHEINNPLASVTNLLYLIRSDESMSPQSRDYLETADRELIRVSQVAAQTLRFHRQSTRPMTIAPETLMDEVLALYGGRLVNFNINVQREYAPDVQLTCYEGDVRQVLNNLIGNAVDVMRNGGWLRVRTRPSTLWSTGRAGVRITVADTGGGMTPKVAKHIFEAFFTTKGNNGTGLGLWISSRIVHKHQGALKVRTSTANEHRGSVFTLWLPIDLAETSHEPWHKSEGTTVEAPES